VQKIIAEKGIADLYGKSLKKIAEAIFSIAHIYHQESI
jgi:acyl-CoA hydrolase